ncbi:methionine--tRNA ligase [Candidatus Woesebacteria bacterium RIFCSPLOWO2_01_FULL_39_61]|uniref:Methionine--tRNA ligase n=1 Tax=Candidatus Woesebacteria bacterium RIFCSPHIGHO2_02_FULL_39_13 TaxID=1802505 RepID=A0A1F7Z256_9BACT|nr:MAG: methionine--tRNA ligase [Candidatus Woesebacteria bacterium RIFCSPHIGHO2_01_FULL_39_95]OGM33591.1 MAG: methionine--tRNA ligase [Candidatus Woesebacteria bacterium RIFCSPHIGHO2_02_FULL_39_13]OGM36679.1 MAG: methionine--tRNA ligase [Candidatus Woesebacteria bacterium RIFCSPHIGHO2_12_FULL_40_20]OGM68552.1 MAG: methionine--tRNA ligase [Candidatus Woesebacteria bacterium RIFCSPLOWO2_01_FULL_39_61]OGM73429.1 MAG: methionine--tRNA ligase [Candidatus Woesebacteria bacterium RIFCSPLOWO2_12_FULL_
MSKFYVTTPIYYVNDVPHVGHAYTTLAADVIARYYRLQLGKNNVFFLTGTDEHGQKVAQAAEENKQTPKEYADSVAPRFKEAWKSLKIYYDYFIRTTEKRHEAVASQLLQKIRDNGYIVEGVYKGWYCVGCEKFLTKTELVNGRCPLHINKEPVYQEERNYFLKLKELSKVILEKIKSGEYEIHPISKKNEILSRLELGVEDISISREGVSWGIPVPWDKNQTIYVWVEALMNYYSATQFLDGKKRFWPADLHIVGKDILWFHSVIWQALLIAADLPLPKHIFAHGFFTIDGQKMSKSLGNVISPKELIVRYGVDGTRYLLLSAVKFGSDGDIEYSKFDEKYNADLANGLGNLIARTAKMAESVNLPGRELKDISLNIGVAIQLVKSDVKEFTRALDLIWKKISKADKFINENKVWALERNLKISALEKLTDDILQIAADLKPFLPETAEKIERQFKGPEIKSENPLFPRL